MAHINILIKPEAKSFILEIGAMPIVGNEDADILFSSENCAWMSHSSES
jgi:hypothetical protein